MTTIASKPIVTEAKSIKPSIPAPAPAPKKVAAVAAPVVAAAKTVAPTVSIGSNVKPSLGLYTASGTAAAAPAKAAEKKNADAPTALSIGAGGVIAGSGHVVVDIESSDSGYDNKIYYSTDNFKTKQYIGIDNKTGSVDLGTFAAGTKIQFGIDNGQGNFFKTGTAAENTDRVEHAELTGTSDGGVRIGFEDLQGGGDRDFNDAIITVRNVPPAAPTASAATVVASTSDPKTNRSGLGDGTNPGQGAGSANSPNQGTSNPGATKAAAPAPVVAAPKPVVPVPQPAKPAAPPTAPVAVKSGAPASIKPAEPSPAKAAVPAAPAKPGTAEVKAPAQSKDKAPVAARPAPQPTPAAQVKDNRSGLGDGTNPGQGAGTVNSPNTGTLNPGGLKKG